MWHCKSPHFEKQLLYDGVPYVIVGRSILECQNGPQRHAGAKKAKNVNINLSLFLHQHI